MSMSDHDKQQVLQEFFAKKVLCFTRVVEPAHISKISI